MRWIWITSMASLLLACGKQEAGPPNERTVILVAEEPMPQPPVAAADPVLYTEPVTEAVTIGQYYCFMDSLELLFDSLFDYSVTEYHLLHSNPWLMDSLIASDYYANVARDSFVQDQRDWIALRAGDSLLIPDSTMAAAIDLRLDSVLLDVNIPEFRMRIMLGEDTLFSFPVRVGQNRQRYLELSGIVTDLRTNPGKGTVVRVERNPYFLNPVNGRHFTSTLRDDNRRTEMPLIPWIETELNGQRFGDMIHPTTNPVTLGKAYSNGCVGTSEANAWRVYFYGREGTAVRVRYDLVVPLPGGDSLTLKDVYHMEGRKTLPPFPKPKPPAPDTTDADSTH